MSGSAVTKGNVSQKPFPWSRYITIYQVMGCRAVLSRREMYHRSHSHDPDTSPYIDRWDIGQCCHEEKCITEAIHMIQTHYHISSDGMSGSADTKGNVSQKPFPWSLYITIYQVMGCRPVLPRAEMYHRSHSYDPDIQTRHKRRISLLYQAFKLFSRVFRSTDYSVSP